jgi:hypothetical protein
MGTKAPGFQALAWLHALTVFFSLESLAKGIVRA